MSGFSNFPSAPSSLLAAQVASFNKGHELSANNTTERQEKERQLKSKLLAERQTEKHQKTEDAKKGFLA